MRSLNSIRQFYRNILSTTLSSKQRLPPPLCILCGESCQSLGIPLCYPCLSDLPIITGSCQICSKPLPINNLTETFNTCGSCLQNQPYYQKSVIPLEYTFPATEIIKQLKYNDKLIFSTILSHIILNKVQQDIAPLPECIIPVPLHPLRLMKRGFNQSALIAKNLSKELKIPVDLKSCRRTKNTLQQTGFSKKQRKNNIHNAFSVRKSFSNKHVAILDDVVTTGSTVNELAKVLQQAGAETVEVWACAHAILD